MIPEIGVEEYAGFLQNHYLDAFVRDGGAAVKVAVVPDDQTATALETSLATRGARSGYVTVGVDAAQTRVNLIQQVFFAVAAEVRWPELAHRVLRSIMEELYGEAAATCETIADVTAAQGLETYTVRNDVHRALEKHVLKNYQLAKDFRIGMVHLCRAAVEPDAYTQGRAASVLEWLRGELRLISAVKDLQIFHKIARHNARAMIDSTARWIRQAGGAGLLLVLDIRRLAVPRRSGCDEGFYYTPATVMDTYEVLRQFIDSTDESENLMVVVVCPASLLEEGPNRSLHKYVALKNRIWDDVRDESTVNPFAPMVRVAHVSGGVV